MNRSENFEEVLNCAFYWFVELTGLSELKEEMKELCTGLELKGTILLSPEGINGSLAGSDLGIRQFQSALGRNPAFAGIEYRESYSSFIPFQNLFVKIKKEIIPVGDPTVRPQKEAVPCLSPRQLKRWLEEGRDFELMDTRNDYEVQWGSFRGATRLGLKTFRQFSRKIDELPQERKRRPLVMFCTGGIRCEKAGIIAKRQGYEEVYQLQGGILKYFEECGGEHYEGSCFVFDERVALDSHLKAVSEVGNSITDPGPG